MLKNVVILGSTGSVGSNTLDVISIHKDKFRVYALVANSNLEKLYLQCIEFQPKFAVILNEKFAKELKHRFILDNLKIDVFYSVDDINTIVKDSQVDIVMASIVGSAGLAPTYNAIKANKKVLLANKESLVCAGKLFQNELRDIAKNVIPVDSEHSAILQCLLTNSNNKNLIQDVNKIILTASGGPFRTLSKQELVNVSAIDAIKHPNWAMGVKISIDSSTLMNKGLELIEAYWLFGIPIEKIKIIIHPQSIIHSMVEYVDGSVIAQAGVPDMKIPISFALAYPERIKSNCEFIDFIKYNTLTFEEPNTELFPCLKLATDAIKAGGVSPIVLNAANEVASLAFYNNKIRFYDISNIIESSLDYFGYKDFKTLEEIFAIDMETRQFSDILIKKYT